MCKILVCCFLKGELVIGCYGFVLKFFLKSINLYDRVIVYCGGFL